MLPLQFLFSRELIYEHYWCHICRDAKWRGRGNRLDRWEWGWVQWKAGVRDGGCQFGLVSCSAVTVWHKVVCGEECSRPKMARVWILFSVLIVGVEMHISCYISEIFWLGFFLGGVYFMLQWWIKTQMGLLFSSAVQKMNSTGSLKKKEDKLTKIAKHVKACGHKRQSRIIHCIV